ncbi:MAG TPA: hypothetical protein VGF61_12435 [Candidatus Acidoferrum sp.]
MSSKRIDLPNALCRFSFSDGRRCAQPAHPAHDGLCLHHATPRSRASRNKNLLREFEPLMRKGVREIDLHNALSALSREVAARRMGRKRAATLAYLGRVLFQSDQMITEDELRAGAGPRWDRIHALLDERDPATDGRTIDVSPSTTTPRNPSR